MLAITESKGFQLTFENGYTISVQFGRGNYCSNKNNLENPEGQMIYECANAEVAAWDSLGDFVSLTDGKPNIVSYLDKTYCSADEVADLINKVKSF